MTETSHESAAGAGPRITYWTLPRLTRELAIVIERGPKPMMEWGFGAILLAVGAVFVIRFALGTIGVPDLAMLIPVALPYMQKLWQDHRESMASAAASPAAA